MNTDKIVGLNKKGDKIIKNGECKVQKCKLSAFIRILPLFIGSYFALSIFHFLFCIL